MNWDRIEGSWKLFKGSAKVQWGKWTDARLDVVAGKREQLAGKVQEAKGVTGEAAQAHIDRWQASRKSEEKPGR